jgi:hypothetical protein
MRGYKKGPTWVSVSSMMESEVREGVLKAVDEKMEHQF